MPLFARHIIAGATIAGWTATAVALGACISGFIAGDYLAAVILTGVVVIEWGSYVATNALLFPGRRLRRAAAGSKGLYREAERLIAAMPCDQLYRTDDMVGLIRLRVPMHARVARYDVGNVDLPQIDQPGVALVEVFTLLTPAPLVNRVVDGARIDLNSDGEIEVLEDGDPHPRGGVRERIRAARRARAGLTLVSVDELGELVVQLRNATPFKVQP